VQTGLLKDPVRTAL